MNFLAQLDALLQAGAAHLPPAFLARQRAFVTSRQLPDGGFPGRLGGSDRYYTDFAVRLAVLCDADETVLARAGDYLAALPPPRDLVELFGTLNLARLLERSMDWGPLSDILAAQALPGGGFAKAPGGPPSVYACFLAALCAEMLAVECPAVVAAQPVVLACQGPAGGFRESPEAEREQTNATAAALGYLGLQGALDAAVAQPAGRFLLARQGPGGGLRAHATAPLEDLLSTFTGLVALMGVPGGECLDLIGIARFVRSQALADGGFAAGPGDEDSDLEYAYYGVATLALVRALYQP